MAVYEIPLAPNDQSLTVKLKGIEYRMRLKYHRATGWVLDIGDATGKPLVCGIGLRPGQDLLGQYQYMGFGGQLFVVTPGDPDHDPGPDDLGTKTQLVFKET